MAYELFDGYYGREIKGQGLEYWMFLINQLYLI